MNRSLSSAITSPTDSDRERSFEVHYLDFVGKRFTLPPGAQFVSLRNNWWPNGDYHNSTVTYIVEVTS